MNDRGDRELRKGHSAEEAFKIYFFPYFRVSGSGFLYLFPQPLVPRSFFFPQLLFFLLLSHDIRKLEPGSGSKEEGGVEI